MNKMILLSAEQRAEMIRETADRIQLTPSAVEKDFWVVWVLDKLFRSELLADKIIFNPSFSFRCVTRWKSTIGF